MRQITHELNVNKFKNRTNNKRINNDIYTLKMTYNKRLMKIY